MWELVCYTTQDHVFALGENKVKAYVMQNDKAQDRAGSITYRNSATGDKITIMFVIDGHGLHSDYSTQIDTGNIVASFIEDVLIDKIKCSASARPEDLLSYYNDPLEGVKFYTHLQESLYVHMTEVLGEHGIEPSKTSSCVWTRRGRELMIIGGSTLNIALIYEEDSSLPKARIYTVGDSLIGYGDYAIDPNLDGANLTPEVVQRLRVGNIEAMYDVRPSDHSHLRTKPIYNEDGEAYPLPIKFSSGKPEPAYYVSNCRGDVALRFTLRGVSDVLQSRYKMAPFSTMGNFGAPEVTRCPQFTDIFEVTKPLSLFSDGIGDCLDGSLLTPEEMNTVDAKCLILNYPKDHPLVGTTRSPFKFVTTNINKEMADHWNDELWIETYRELGKRLFGDSGCDDQALVMFRP